MSERLIVARSVLNPVVPLGVGTPQVESLNSYFSRVAISHCIRASDLAHKIAEAMDLTLNPKWDWKSLNLNGISDSAEKWSQVLANMTTVESLSALTLLPWRGVIAERGLFATESRWCPLCFIEDRNTAKAPYFRLAWHVGVVTACASHNTKLISVCPGCGCPETRRKCSYVVPGWCTKCGEFLGSIRDRTGATPEEAWIASQVGAMLARQAMLASSPSREDLLDCIRNLITQLDCGRNALFARRIGLNKSTVHYWVAQGGTPTLSALLRIASFTQVELHNLLTGDLTGWSSACINDSQRTRSLPQRKKRASPVADRSDLIRAHLAALIESKEPVSVQEAARQLDVHPRQLYQSAYKDALAIGKGWMQHRRARAQRNRDIALRAIEAAYSEILSEGKCANLDQLRQHIPKEVLGRVRDVFALLGNVKKKIGTGLHKHDGPSREFDSWYRVWKPLTHHGVLAEAPLLRRRRTRSLPHR